MKPYTMLDRLKMSAGLLFLAVAVLFFPHYVGTALFGRAQGVSGE